MSHSTVGGDLSVNVASLLLVKIDLSLKDVNLLSLAFKLLLKDVLLHLVVLLLLFVLVVEDLLVGAVQGTVEVELVVTEVSDQVKQACVPLDGLGEVSLSLSQVSLSLFLSSVALLLHLLELVLQVEDNLGWSTHLKSL